MFEFFNTWGLGGVGEKARDSAMLIDNFMTRVVFSRHVTTAPCYFQPIFHFFNKICQAPNLYLTLRLLPKEFNSHKFSFVRFVVGEISGLFQLTPSTPELPNNDPKMVKTAKTSNF